MPTSLGILIALGLPLLVGTALPGRLGLAIRWYVGMTGISVFVMTGWGLRLPQTMVLGMAILGSLALSLLGIRRLRSAERPDRRQLIVAALLFSLLATPLMRLLMTTINQPVFEWDGLHIWWAKTRALYFWVPPVEMPLPNYPNLGPTAWMLILKLVGISHESLGRTIVGAAYIAFVASLVQMFGPRAPWSALLAVAMCFPAVFDAGALVNGYQDGFVVASVGIAAVLLARILWQLNDLPSLKELSRIELLLAAFVCGVPGMVKNEGALIGLILVLSFVGVLLVHRSPRRWPELAKSLWPFAAVYLGTAAVWPLLLVWNGFDPTKVQANAFTAGAALAALLSHERWPSIRPHFVEYLTIHQQLYWIAASSSAGAALLVPRARKPILMVAAATALHLGFVAWVFFSTRLDLAWHLSTAFNRLAFQNTGLLLTLAVLGLGALGDGVVQELGKLWKARKGLHS